MKYLKIYEGFSNFYSISENDFLMSLRTNGQVKTPNGMVSNEEVESFTKLELNSIKSLLGDKYTYDNTWISEASRKKMSKLDISLKDQSGYHTDREGFKRKYRSDIINSYVIIKLRDEWFLLEDMTDLSSHQYYKCDQIEGLLKLIEHIK